MRFGEITVDSDFTTTALLGVLFIVLSLMLLRDIRHILWSVPSQIAIRGTLNRLSAALMLAYGLVFVFRWPNRLVRVGCALFAAHLGLSLALTYFRISPNVPPTLAFADAIVVQISLVAFLVAIAQWFRTVVRWTPPSPGKREE
jgi:hypothetical protein